MRTEFGKKVEDARIKTGKFSSKPGQQEGHFEVWRGNRRLFCRVSTGADWDHVSVSVSATRRNKKTGKVSRPLPSWEDMAYIKDLFWGEEETVIQIHPPHSQYVDNAQVLHLWKPQGVKLPLPEQILVGLPGVTQDDLKMIGIHKTGG